MSIDSTETSRSDQACPAVPSDADHKESMRDSSTRSSSLLLIGGLPTPSRMLGGEVEKNRQLVAELTRLSVETVSCNVSDWRLRPLATGLALVRSIRASSQIVISVATPGLFSLILSPLSTMLGRKRVCVLAIGGMLDQHIARLKPPLRARVERFLHDIDLVVMETSDVVTNMSQLGYRNIMRLPNFRALQKASHDLADKPQAGGVLRCVFLSRVTETKGIDDAVAAVVMAQKREPRCQCSLDVYGPLEGVDPAVWPTTLVHYEGVVSPDEVADCLEHYDVMLFPTFHEGEGFPGVLIDAAFVGLPVIVTAWHANAEIIADGINGFVVPVHNPEAIADRLIYLANNPEVLVRLRDGARESASRYDSAVVVPQLLTALKHKGWIFHTEPLTEEGGLD